MLLLDNQNNHSTINILEKLTNKLFNFRPSKTVDQKKSKITETRQDRLIRFIAYKATQSPYIDGLPHLQYCYDRAIKYMLEQINKIERKNITIKDLFPDLQGQWPQTHHWINFCKIFSCTVPFAFTFYLPHELSNTDWLDRTMDEFLEQHPA